MTKIEWTDVVWNPVVGCSRVSKGCEHCYAERVAHRGLVEQHRGLTVVGKHGPRWTGEVRFLPERLGEPLRWRKPRRVFVNSMSDLFHEHVPNDVIDQVLAVMLLAPQHTFQVLTKRPERMRAYLWAPDLYDRVLTAADRVRHTSSPARRLLSVGISNPARFPAPWIWLGVSVEDQQTADERVPLLLDTPAAVRWVSQEPQIGPVAYRSEWLRGRRYPCDDCGAHDGPPDPDCRACHGGGWCGPRLDWIVIGGESGPSARPFDLAWARSTVAQCREAGVPVFVKQLGACASDPVNGLAGAALLVPEEAAPLISRRLHDRKGADPSEWPEDLRVREFPGHYVTVFKPRALGPSMLPSDWVDGKVPRG